MYIDSETIYIIRYMNQSDRYIRFKRKSKESVSQSFENVYFIRD